MTEEHSSDTTDSESFNISISNNVTSIFNNSSEYDERSNYHDYQETTRLMQVYIRPVVIIGGTVGNILAFCVMRRGSMKKVSTCFYMAILALADTGFLWVGGFVGWIRYLTEWTVNPRIWGDCKLYKFLFFFCEHYSSALLVIMSIEKFFALYFPLKTRTVCTVGTARWVSGITSLIFIIFNAQSLFIYEAQTDSHGYDRCLYIRVSETYRLVFFRLNSALYSFGPFILMIIFNSAIIYKFLKTKFQNRYADSQSTSQALVKSATKGTAMLLTVSFMFIILTAPISIGLAIGQRVHPIVHTVTSLLGYLNHGINGVLYCIVGSRFRNELKKILCCTGKISKSTTSGTFSQNMANETSKCSSDTKSSSVLSRTNLSLSNSQLPSEDHM